MADFCTKCSQYLFPPDTDPDIDVESLASELDKDGYYISVLCEGCGMRAIESKNGIRVVLIDPNNYDRSREFSLEEYINYTPEEWIEISKEFLNLT